MITCNTVLFGFHSQKVTFEDVRKIVWDYMKVSKPVPLGSKLGACCCCRDYYYYCYTELEQRIDALLLLLLKQQQKIDLRE
jgi:hypothetical protein